MRFCNVLKVRKYKSPIYTAHAHKQRLAPTTHIDLLQKSLTFIFDLCKMSILANTNYELLMSHSSSVVTQFKVQF